MKTDSSDLDVIRQCEGEPDRLRQAVALFRYGVIADMTQLSLHHRGLYKLLREADREYDIPGDGANKPVNAKRRRGQP